MSIEEARTALDVIRRQAQIAVDALIDVMIDAKLSPAPVGEDRRKFVGDIIAGIKPEVDRLMGKAPTPPAKDTGETTAAWRTNLLILTTQAEEDRQELDGSHCRDCADENGRCPSNLVPCDPMQALAEAHPPRLLALLRDFADLEARLAKAERTIEALNEAFSTNKAALPSTLMSHLIQIFGAHNAPDQA